MDPVKPKPDITLGNILSIVTQVVSLIVMLVTVVLAYGRLQAKDDVHDTRLAIIEAQIGKREVAEQAASSRLSIIEGDIRVIRQILESPPPPRSR
jgi:hypothetical protein